MSTLRDIESTVPIIFTPPVQRLTMPAFGRIVSLAVAAACMTVLIIAVRLPPSPDGLGTHQQMGYPACQFLQVTGIPCWSCGMTTSFAWFVRGNWLASFYVQPMGFVLAVLTGGCFWASLYIALTGRPIQRLLRQIPATRVFMILMIFSIAAWGWKIFIHLHGIDGWR